MKDNLVDILILTTFCCSLVVLAAKVGEENMGKTNEYTPSSSASWEESGEKELREWRYVESVPINNMPMKNIIRVTTSNSGLNTPIRDQIHF